MKGGVTLALASLLVSSLASGCDRPKPLRIGAQNFAEGHILAELMARTAEAEGIPVERITGYTNSRQCLDALQEGMIDAYPEYTGDLVSLAGVPPPAEPEVVADVASDLVAPLGLHLGARFGLRNDWAVVMRSDVALRLGITTISGLLERPDPIRFAVDEEFASRMSDGHDALVRRYGLVVEEPLVVRRKEQVRAELVEGRAEVAVIHETDPALGDFGVVRLEDDLGFFPAYEPAPLIRDDTLADHPQLSEAWSRLAGKISTARMRELVGRVERGGEDPALVARSALGEIGLESGQLPESEQRRPVSLAVRPLSLGAYDSVRAAQAVREVMPTRPLRLVVVARPAEAVRDGRARFALVGGEEFLEASDGEDAAARHMRMGEHLEAVGAVGVRMGHLMVPTGAAPLTDLDTIRVATGPRNGSSHRVAVLLIDSLELRRRVDLVPDSEPARLLEEHRVDALFIHTGPGDPHVRSLLATGDLELHSITGVTDVPHMLRHPILRVARLPADTYAGQPEPIETVASQTVLASYRPTAQGPVGHGGPAMIPGLGGEAPHAVPNRTAAQLAAALGTRERVDPLLPASRGLRAETKSSQVHIGGDPAVALMNVLALLFLIGMGVFYFLPEPAVPALEPARSAKRRGPRREPGTPGAVAEEEDLSRR